MGKAENRARWETLDWTFRDADLARELGVSRERVRQIRYLLGKAKSQRNDRAPDRYAKISIEFRRWARSHPDQVSNHTTSQLAKQFGLNYNVVFLSLRKLGMKAKPSLLGLTLNKDNLRSWCQIDPATECWCLQESRNLTHLKRLGQEYARTRVFRLFNGSIPDVEVVFTKCCNESCLNPAHMATGRWAEACRYWFSARSTSSWVIPTLAKLKRFETRMERKTSPANYVLINRLKAAREAMRLLTLALRDLQRKDPMSV
jgi:hypothetical protein